MRPVQLEYKRLVSDQHYGNVQIGLVCELGPDDDADQVLAMMQRTVHSSLFWTLLNGGTNPNSIRIGEGTPEIEVADCQSCWRPFPAAALAPGFGKARVCPRCLERLRQGEATGDAAGQPESDTAAPCDDGLDRQEDADSAGEEAESDGEGMTVCLISESDTD